MQDNKRDYKPFIVFAAVVILVNVAALWFFLREDAPTPDFREYASTPEEIAARYVNDNIDDLGEEIVGFMAPEVLPVISKVEQEAGGEYPEDMIRDVVMWDYSAEPTGEDGVYNVTATSLVNLEIDAEGLVNGEVMGALPFLIVVDMDAQSVRRASPQFADASMQESCALAAFGADFSGVLIEKIEETDSQSLTDRQRREWFDLLDSNGGGSALDACKDLWSEPVTAENADKRNADYYSSCFYDPYKDVEEEYLNQTQVLERNAWQVATADLLELMERPYTDLTPTDRMVLRGYFNQSDEPIYRSSGYGVDQSCAYYYPQLFYGRWVPFSYE